MISEFQLVVHFVLNPKAYLHLLSSGTGNTADLIAIFLVCTLYTRSKPRMFS